MPEGETVLGALQHIYEYQDSSLAFQYGCRFKGCGLCTMKINGRARLACATRVEEGMEFSPLDHLPVLRDLAIDRRPLTEFLARNQLYLIPSSEKKLPAVFEIPPPYQQLAQCVECLACVSECPSFELSNERFGGPLTFVKLAQLHVDPRDTLDRKAQAKALGIDACLTCTAKCSCPIGVPIRKAAIQPLS
jgi:succinate dehydrogenase/fumarate reductase iron-sulfur protein